MCFIPLTFDPKDVFGKVRAPVRVTLNGYSTLGRQIERNDMIRLVGPGGAGKSTAGALLAQQLGVAFLDLDEQFIANAGDISAYLDAHGYDVYAERNVNVYLGLAAAAGREQVLALSSGFMTYRPDIHPEYESCRREIVCNPSTFVLLPSLDFETCVAEIVRRQLIRPFARSAKVEEQVIRTRFPIYVHVPARKVESMRPVREVVEELMAAIAAQRAAAAGDIRRPPRWNRVLSS